jgi:hypothetical protein
MRHGQQNKYNKYLIEFWLNVVWGPTVKGSVVEQHTGTSVDVVDRQVGYIAGT